MMDKICVIFVYKITITRFQSQQLCLKMAWFCQQTLQIPKYSVFCKEEDNELQKILASEKH